jgi:PST family polysaccharide transporter
MIGSESISPPDARHSPQRFLRNWAALLSSDVLTQGMSLLAAFRIVRHLTPAEYGSYSIVLVTASLFTLLAVAGITLVIVTEVATHRALARPLLFAALRARTVTIAVGIAGATAYYHFVRQEPGLFVVVITAIMITNDGLVDLPEAIAFGQQTMKYSSALTLLSSGAWLIALYVIPLHYLTIHVLLILYASIQIAETIAYYGLIVHNGMVSGDSGVHYRAAHLLSQGAPYLWINVVGNVTTQLPIVLLASFQSSAAVGTYTAAYRLVLPMTVVLHALSRAVIPYCVTVRNDSAEALAALVSRGITALLLLTGLAGLAITLVSTTIVPLILGSQYDNASDIFVNHVWVMCMYSPSIIIGAAFVALNVQKVFALASTIGACFTLALVGFGARMGPITLSEAVLAGYAITLAIYLVALSTQLSGDRWSAGLLVENVALAGTLLLASRLLLVLDDTPARAGIAVTAAALAAYRGWPGTRDIVRHFMVTRARPVQSEV